MASRLYPGFGSGKGAYDGTFECRPYASIERADLEAGDKIMLPPSALRDITRLRLPFPLVFRVVSDKAPRKDAAKPTVSFEQFAGAFEFSAPEGVAFLPQWMMENAKLRAGARAVVSTVRAPPPGTYVKLRPHSAAFIELAAAIGPRELLETAMRSYSVLSTGERLVVDVADTKYFLDVLEVRPGRAICLFGNLDLEVDFAPLAGSKEEAEEREATAAAAAAAGAGGGDGGKENDDVAAVTAAGSRVSGTGGAAAVRVGMTGAAGKPKATGTTGSAAPPKGGPVGKAGVTAPGRASLGGLKAGSAVAVKPSGEPATARTLGFSPSSGPSSRSPLTGGSTPPRKGGAASPSTPVSGRPSPGGGGRALAPPAPVTYAPVMSASQGGVDDDEWSMLPSTAGFAATASIAVPPPAILAPPVASASMWGASAPSNTAAAAAAPTDSSAAPPSAPATFTGAGFRLSSGAAVTSELMTSSSTSAAPVNAVSSAAAPPSAAELRSMRELRAAAAMARLATAAALADGAVVVAPPTVAPATAPVATAPSPARREALASSPPPTTGPTTASPRMNGAKSPSPMTASFASVVAPPPPAATFLPPSFRPLAVGEESKEDDDAGGGKEDEGEGGAALSRCRTCGARVPSASLTMHALRCARTDEHHRLACGTCEAVVRKRDMQRHVHCGGCRVLVEPSEECAVAVGDALTDALAASLAVHVATVCVARPTVCECGARMPASALIAHRDACPAAMETCTFCKVTQRRGTFAAHIERCGSRTAECDACGKLVVLKRMQEHVESGACGRSAAPAAGSAAISAGDSGDAPSPTSAARQPFAAAKASIGSVAVAPTRASGGAGGASAPAPRLAPTRTVAPAAVGTSSRRSGDDDTALASAIAASLATAEFEGALTGAAVELEDRAVLDAIAASLVQPAPASVPARGGAAAGGGLGASSRGLGAPAAARSSVGASSARTGPGSALPVAPLGAPRAATSAAAAAAAGARGAAAAASASATRAGLPLQRAAAAGVHLGVSGTRAGGAGASAAGGVKKGGAAPAAGASLSRRGGKNALACTHCGAGCSDFEALQMHVFTACAKAAAAEDGS